MASAAISAAFRNAAEDLSVTVTVTVTVTTGVTARLHSSPSSAFKSSVASFSISGSAPSALRNAFPAQLSLFSAPLLRSTSQRSALVMAARLP
jgi:hypothetical protein